MLRNKLLNVLIRVWLCTHHGLGQCSLEKQMAELTSGMWSRTRHISLKTVSRCTNVSSQTKSSTSRSRLHLRAICLSLGP